MQFYKSIPTDMPIIIINKAILFFDKHNCFLTHLIIILTPFKDNDRARDDSEEGKFVSHQETDPAGIVKSLENKIK